MSDSENKSVRTLIVDDHPVVRFGVKHILEAEPDIEVVGDVEGMDGIADVLDRLSPDVVLLDLELADLGSSSTPRTTRRTTSSRRPNSASTATCSRAARRKRLSVPYAASMKVAQPSSRRSPQS
jgi:DNA-binding NarL/FixJ family response regulator